MPVVGAAGDRSGDNCLRNYLVAIATNAVRLRDMKLGVLFPLALLFLLACSEKTGGSSDPTRSPPEVRHHGEVHAVMQGEWDPVISLEEGLEGEDSYGLGALSDLRGEFVALPRRIWLSYPTTVPLPDVKQVTASDETAALLVSARVPAFRKRTFDVDVASTDVETALAELAKKAGVDVTKPFPFLLEGTLRAVHWHVVDGTRVPPGTRPNESAQKGVVESAEGTIVGFYSEAHQGVFTMMGQKTHMHAVFPGRSVAGHVESLEIPAGATLSVP